MDDETRVLTKQKDERTYMLIRLSAGDKVIIESDDSISSKQTVSLPRGIQLIGANVRDITDKAIVFTTSTKNILSGTRLTARELDIIQRVLQGDKNSVIAKELGISEGTVKCILSGAYRKLNISSRCELIALNDVSMPPG